MKAQNIPKQHQQYKTSTTTFPYYSSLSQIHITGKADKTLMSCLPDEYAEEDEEGSLDPQSEDAVHVGHLHG